MSQSLMVYPNNNDFLMAPSMLDDNNVAKLMNSEHLESYLTSASTSPVQDYLMSPSSYHPQQDQHNQRQHQLQFHATPNSPPYAIVKTEEVQAQSAVDYHLMFPSTFDLSSSTATTNAQEQHILPSQRSPFTNVSLIQQHQQHQQQQHQHEQQLRMQHRQLQQQQLMYNTPSTSSIISSMVSATTSSGLYAPSAITTSAPFFHASTLVQDDSPALTFHRRSGYTPAAHPAAPKRKCDEPSLAPRLSPQLAADSIMPDESTTSPSTSPLMTLTTSSRLDKVKTTRSTKVMKSSPSASPVSSYSSIADITVSDVTVKGRVSNRKAMAIKKATSESRESSEQPESASDRLAGHAGNVTHPRRAAQNRAAQRTFRNRRKAYIKELEQKVQEIDRTRDLMDAVRVENQEIWRRFQILETLASRNGVQLPVFPPLTSLAATTMTAADGITSISVVTGNEYNEMMMMNAHHLLSSDDE